MVATLTTVDAILKEIYGPRIVDQLQSESVALKRIKPTSDNVTTTQTGGKYVDFPIKVQRNHGMGYRNENEQLPAAKRQGYAEVHVPLKYGYGRVRLTGQIMELAQTNAQAFASAMDREMEGIKETVAKDSNRVVYGAGSGLLATIADAAAGATSHTVTSDNIYWLEEGMQVDVLVKANGNTVVLDTAITAISVTNVNTATVTFEDAFTGVNDGSQGVYRQGSYNKEPTGLDLIVDDTATLHTVDPATTPKWSATVKDNGGTNRALSEGLMIETVDDVRIKGGTVSLILTSLGCRRAYFNLLTQQRRYPNTQEFAGGFKGLAFNHGKEIPVVEDVDHPTNSMYFLDESTIRTFQANDWEWMDRDGSRLKWVRDFDAYEAVLHKYWEIGTEARRSHAVLEDITEG